MVLGVGKGVLFREVSSFQRLQEWYLGWEKVSCLERCPQFRSVLIPTTVIHRHNNCDLHTHTHTHTILALVYFYAE